MSRIIKVYIFIAFVKCIFVNGFIGDYRYFWNSKDVQPNDYNRYYLPNGFEFNEAPFYEVNINSLPREWLRGEAKPVHKPSEKLITSAVENSIVEDNAIRVTAVQTPTVQWGDSRCRKQRGAFPLSKSCSSYLNCWDGYAEEQECPGELLFSEAGYCDYPYRVECGGRPIDLHRPGCHYPYNAYRNPNNCSEFFLCAHQLYYLFRCPEDLQFNEALGVCDYPYRVNCEDRRPSFRFPEATKSSMPIPGYENSAQVRQNNFPFYYQNVWNISPYVASSRHDAMRQLNLNDIPDASENQLKDGD